MLETQIKAEFAAFRELLPIYLKVVSFRLKIGLKISKITRNQIVFSVITNSKDERFKIIESLYGFGNLFNIQKIEFKY